MLKNKFRFLVFVLVICVLVTTVFTKQTKNGKAVSNMSKNQILTKTESQYKDSIKVFSLKGTDNLFWTLSKESYLAIDGGNQPKGSVVSFLCFAACIRLGGSPSYCGS